MATPPAAIGSLSLGYVPVEDDSHECTDKTEQNSMQIYVDLKAREKQYVDAQWTEDLLRACEPKWRSLRSAFYLPALFFPTDSTESSENPESSITEIVSTRLIGLRAYRNCATSPRTVVIDTTQSVTVRYIYIGPDEHRTVYSVPLAFETPEMTSWRIKADLLDSADQIEAQAIASLSWGFPIPRSYEEDSQGIKGLVVLTDEHRTQILEQVIKDSRRSRLLPSLLPHLMDRKDGLPPEAVDWNPWDYFRGES